MTFQPSEYSEAPAERLFGGDTFLWAGTALLAGSSATVFLVNPLVMRTVLPESSYATRTLAGLLLTPLEFLAVRAILNRK
jgi:hypothetical protein